MPSACDQAFAVPELFEEIFCHLFDISNDNTVCDWREFGNGFLFLADFESECEHDKKICPYPHHRWHPESVAQAEIMRARRVCRHWNATITHSPRLQRKAARLSKPDPGAWRSRAHAIQIHPVSMGVTHHEPEDIIFNTYRGGQQVQFELDRHKIRKFHNAARGKDTSLHDILFSKPPPTIFDVALQSSRGDLCHAGRSKYDADGNSVHNGSRLVTVKTPDGFTIGDILEIADQILRRCRKFTSLRFIGMDHHEKERKVRRTVTRNPRLCPGD